MCRDCPDVHDSALYRRATEAGEPEPEPDPDQRFEAERMRRAEEAQEQQ